MVGPSGPDAASEGDENGLSAVEISESFVRKRTYLKQKLLSNVIVRIIIV